MDLALEMGKSLEDLDKMSTVEFDLWKRYAMKRILPRRRIEVYLAQIAKVVAQTAGNAELTIADFLLDDVLADDSGDEEQTAEEFFAFNPRNVEH